MCLLKALISIGIKVVRRLVIYFPKHMLTHWLQPTEFQEDLEYFKSYLKKGKQKKPPPLFQVDLNSSHRPTNSYCLFFNCYTARCFLPYSPYSFRHAKSYQWMQGCFGVFLTSLALLKLPRILKRSLYIGNALADQSKGYELCPYPYSPSGPILFHAWLCG